jgi:uncharacterized OB-fold protein
MMRRDCPDCGQPLEPIQVIDRGYMDQPHKGLVYAPAQVEKGLFGLPKGPKVIGTIDAWMCKGCGRVLLYAKPNE